MATRREFMHAAAALCLPLGICKYSDPQEEAPMPDTDSDVGSLFPFISSQAPKEPDLSWLRPEFANLRAWKKRARGRLLDLLHYAPPRCDPLPEVVNRQDRGDYVQETVRFNTTPDIRVTAYVLIPKRAKLPAAGIVALHDHGGFYMWGKEKLTESADEHPALTAFKKQSYSGRSIAAELARRGYVVIVIDMFYWGDRRPLLDSDPADWRERLFPMPSERVSAFNQRASEMTSLVNSTIQSAGFTWPGVMLWDDLRTLDYLLTRPEVDKSRVGCVGLSVGGFRSCHLAALDDRIKAAVVVGWMCSFPDQLRRHVRWTIGPVMLIPGLYAQMDYPDVASMAAPTPLLVINGSKDTLFEPRGVRAAFDRLAACYRKAGALDKVRTRLYDTPHEFNAEMQSEAWAWLDRHLKGRGGDHNGG